MTKDYYKILDITEFSTSEEIKNAYRKLARKWHPDIAGNTPDAIKMFKEINEAYQILSDKTKKSDYDKARRFYNYASSNRTENKTQNNTTTPNFKETFKETQNEKNEKSKKMNFSFNWEEFLAQKCREAQYKKEKEIKAPQKGEDIYTDIEITIFEAISGCEKVINMLQTQVCPKCGGRKFINGTKCSECNGKGETSKYKKLSVKIPAGVKNKSRIRLAEEGEQGLFGGRNGDLYLIINIQEPKNYKTDGLNILKTIAITPYEAVLGTEISISTLRGNVGLKITPNTQNGQKIRLRGCGIEQNHIVGDMIVTVEIQIPKNLSKEEIELYKKLQEISTSSVR